jgi:hypothetical protein
MPAAESREQKLIQAGLHGNEPVCKISNESDQPFISYIPESKKGGGGGGESEGRERLVQAGIDGCEPVR